MRCRWAASLLALGVLADVAHSAPSSLDKPAFSATPAELLAAAKAATIGGGDVVVLRQDSDVSWDDKGRMTSTWRLVFTVTTKAGADDWDTLSSSYLPANQDKPKVRARVIDPNGRAVDLDASLVTDVPQHDAAQAQPTDRRHVTAPLPHLSVGSVVEEQVITVDREPLLGGGSAYALDLGGSYPLASVHATFSSPISRKLRTLAVGFPSAVKPKIETVGGRQVITYVLGALPVQPEYERYVLPEARPFVYLIATPVASWGAIAREYRKLVDKQIAAGPFALPAELPKTATIETVRAMLGWLQTQIRYTGVGFDDATAVPSTPADIVKRGTADSTDMAVLLVALLRQAGIRADLALVNVGPGPDLDRDIPGVNLFDHVLVRARIGKSDVWLDPVDRLAQPGQLHAFDQGRYTLPITDDANALLKAPSATAADNTVREVRTFEIAENGAAKVTEVSREGGAFEADQRLWVRDTATDAVRKAFTEYASGEYKGTLDSYSSTKPDDLTKPFEVTLVVKEASRGYTHRTLADVYLFPSDLLKKLPDPLGKPEETEPMRKFDFRMALPHIYEIENRIVLPPGFTMPTPAPDKTRDVGPFKLVEKQRVDGPAFVVTYRLEAAKQQLTPTEVAAVQASVRELRKEDAEHLVIPLTAHVLADKGKFRDAIDEVNKLIKLHPKEALHHQQLAHVLLKAGAGEAARRAARKAVEVEPKSADAHVVLAWVLQNDTFGNWLGFDHDRAGARAALEKARKLDPKHIGAASDLAALLERNPHGQRFETGSDVRASIEAWRAARTLDPDDTDKSYNLAMALLWVGEGAEAEKVLRSMPAAERRDQLIIVASAVGSGAEAALRTATSLASGSTRKQNVTAAAGVLALLRRYDLMRSLFADIKAMQGNSKQEQLFLRLARSDKPFKPTKTPQDVVVAMELLAIYPERANASNPYWDKATRDEVNEKEAAGRSALDKELMTTGFLEDIMRSTWTNTVEGDAGLWRVDIDQIAATAQIYVAGDRGTPKVIGTNETPQGVGRHLLRLLAKNDEKSALRLLDWLAKDLAGKRDLLAHRFTSLWGANLPRGRKDMETAAAVLTKTSDAARAIPILSACKPSTKEGQFSCDAALAEIYKETSRWRELADHAEGWITRGGSTSTLPAVSKAYALAHLGNFDEADKVLADGIAKEPDNRLLIFTNSDIAVGHGQLAEGIRRLDPLTTKSSPSFNELNQVSWLKLIEGKDVKSAVMQARQALQLAPKEPHVANTLAAIEAELGELDAAKQHLDISVESHRQTKPGDADMFVHGRILEQLGLVDDAIAIYRQVKPDKPSWLFTRDANDLAKGRLKALGVTK